MWIRRILIAAIVAVLPACGGPTDPSGPDGSLSGGVLATFAVASGSFKVWVTNPAAIIRLEALQRGQGGGSIPNGRVLRGSGRAAHNAPYSWHLDPDEIEIVEIAIELCDGSPDYVEANVAEFADRIGRYCPWGAKLVEIRDDR